MLIVGSFHAIRRNDFIEMMEIMDKRLNDKGKNWRHVFKTLTLLDYLLHAGSENCVIYFRDNIYVVKTLREFQYIDDYGKDQGANGESQVAARQKGLERGFVIASFTAASPDPSAGSAIRRINALKKWVGSRPSTLTASLHLRSASKG